MGGAAKGKTEEHAGKTEERKGKLQKDSAGTTARSPGDAGTRNFVRLQTIVQAVSMSMGSFDNS